MEFPNRNVIIISGRNSLAEIENERKQIAAQLRQCHQILFEASCVLKRAVFKFRSEEMLELQRRQELLVCHKQQVLTFLNDSLKSTQSPFRLDAVEQEGTTFRFSFLVKEVSS